MTTHLDVLPNLTFIDDNFAFCHTFFPIILLMQVKSCNNVANKQMYYLLSPPTYNMPRNAIQNLQL